MRLRSANTVTFPIRDTRGRLAAGRSLQIEIDAAWAGEWRMFWLWREMGRNSSVSEPFAWQLRGGGRKGHGGSGHGAGVKSQSDPLAEMLCLLLGRGRAWRSILAARMALLQGQRAGIAVQDTAIIEQRGSRSYLRA